MRKRRNEGERESEKEGTGEKTGEKAEKAEKADKETAEQTTEQTRSAHRLHRLRTLCFFPVFSFCHLRPALSIVIACRRCAACCLLLAACRTKETAQDVVWRTDGLRSRLPVPIPHLN